MRFPFAPLYASRRSPVFARNLVATSHPLATQAGLSMLHRGGNAVDAAIAAGITLTVVEPTGNGLGSDAFCVLWDGQKLHGLNASGRSPAAWSPSRFAHLTEMPKRGWEAVTVPGAVSAWVDLSARFGKLPFEALFDSAIGYAQSGFCVTPVIAELWERGGRELKDEPGFSQMFTPEGRAPRAGEVFRSEDLARSLRLISETRGEAFYRGELAARIVDFAGEHGAVLSKEDLANHENDWCGTISHTVGDASLCEIPPNGQGIAALIALGILRRFDLQDLDPDGADALHLQIEAMKLALADIDEHLSDIRFMRDVTVPDLLDEQYLSSRAKLISLQKAQVHEYGVPNRGGTVCLATGDASGMIVSYIQSNYEGFGSGVVVPSTGISLQNRGYGFTLRNGHPNEVGPSKRPFHTIIPGFVMKGDDPLMAFGLMGGRMQAQGHLQMFLRTQVWSQDPQTAIDAPRWRLLGGANVAIEPGFPDDVLSALASRGHQFRRQVYHADFGFGGAQAVMRLGDAYVAGSDPRKDGCAAGF